MQIPIFCAIVKLLFFLFQALIDLMADLKMSSVAILYDEEVDVLLWKRFLEVELRDKIIPPTFSHLPSDLSDNKSQ